MIQNSNFIVQPILTKFQVNFVLQLLFGRQIISQMTTSQCSPLTASELAQKGPGESNRNPRRSLSAALLMLKPNQLC